MKAKLILFLSFLVFGASLAFGYSPNPGGELSDQFRSPIFLGRSGAAPSGESVSGDVLNPAASAQKQRTHVDASYLSIISDGTLSGHIGNLGASFPYPVGVFSGSFSFLTSDVAAVDLGQRAALNLSFSKDLFPSLMFGFGIRGQYGSNGGETGFAGGADLGIVHLMGDVGPLRDFSWGLAVTQMGNGLAVGADTGSPAPFTPALSAEATLVDKEKVDISSSLRFTFPTFQDVTAHAGLAARLFDRVSVSTGWDYDLYDAANGATPSLLPSVALSYHARTDIKKTDGFVAEQGWARSEIDVHSGFAPLYGDVYAAGLGMNAALGVVDEEAPEISVTYPEERYLSPNNDGASDDLLLPIDISDSRYIKGWSVTIYNEAGAPVQTIENKEQREENLTFRNVVDRLLYVKQGVDVPDEVRWDGRTAEGGIAPDGTYRFEVSAVDDNANKSTTEQFTVTIDATPPSATIVEPEDPDALIFSPNGDSNKDTITVVQSGSPEDTWTVQVRDSGDRIVREESFTSAELSDFEWDGRDNEGALVPDGVYSVSSFAVDRAENRGSAELTNIIVNTEPTPLGLTIDRSQISPNGDGVADTLVLTPDVPVQTGIREWRFDVKDASGRVVRSEDASLVPPRAWIFDGRDNAGNVVPEGSYAATYTVRYNNGNTPEAVSPQLVVDVTRPFASVQSNVDVFSPNGDGRIDSVTFAQAADEIRAWNATISNSAGEGVRTYGWSGQPASELVWDGRDQAGALLPDGVYAYRLAGSDAAGNRTETSPVRIQIDTRETPVFVSTNTDAFSPNGDGSKDRITIIPELADSEGVTEYVVAVVDSDERRVADIRGRSAPPSTLEWDGRLPGGSTIPDGRYQMELVVDYLHGNRSVALSSPFVVDTVAPNATVTASETLFSPDGDGNKDDIEFAQHSSEEASWISQFVAADGEVVREIKTTGTLSTFSWDGTDNNGNRIPDGRYRYRVLTTDEAGNSFETATAAFTVDTAPVEVRLSQSATAFSPNGDDVKDNVVITPVATSDDAVQEWTIRMADAEGDTVIEQEFTGPLEPYIWNGEASRGKAPDGEYRALVVVRFEKGNIELASTARPIVLDTVAPTASVRLGSDVFSPNGDGNLDSLAIQQETSTERRWVATISDEQENLVRSYEWVERPTEALLFDGLADGRRRLPDGTYTYELFSTDDAGNTGGSGRRPFDIVTAETPLALVANVAAFSPNGDNRIDTVTFRPQIGNQTGITAYAFEIRDESDRIVFEDRGSRPPAQFVWNGTGQSVADGQYRGRLSLDYRHGNAPVAESELVTRDTVAPGIAAEAAFRIFSPNGDNQRDSLAITQNSDAIDEWTASIIGNDGRTVREYVWNGTVRSFTWNGTDEAGNRVPDGNYRYAVSGEDSAGNRSEAVIDGLAVDTRPTRLYVTIGAREFSPNSDGTKDTLPIRLINTRTDGVEYRTVELVAADNTVAKAFRAPQAPDREGLTWDGLGETGAAPDGVYRVRYRVAYNNGTIAEAISPPARLDTTPPQLRAELQGLPFSPDNDGLNDELGIDLSVSDAGAIEQWSFEVNDRNDRLFQLFEGTGTPRDSLIWDGRSQTGELVISAEDYPYAFTATDTVGNRAVVTGKIPVDILVIRDGDRLKVQISNINFEPNSPELRLDEASEEGQKNLYVLDRLVEVFDKYQSYQIRVEGHAVNITGTDREEREELQPLSLSRAETVRQALIARGMDADRITTLGRGGTEPLVPHTDLENRWKNRRVEFILIR